LNVKTNEVDFGRAACHTIEDGAFGASQLMSFPPFRDREYWSDLFAIVVIGLVKALVWLIGR
jgi:hypothetical protein